MHSSAPTWQQFEDLVRRILEANNFTTQHYTKPGEAGFDLIGQAGSEEWAIEVKYYRTARAQPSLIEAAATRLVYYGIKEKIAKGMLVVSCAIPDVLRLTIEEKYSITIVDRLFLKSWANVSPELVEELDALLETDASATPELSSPQDDPRSKSKFLDTVQTTLQDFRGAELCEKLKKVKRGKDAWAEYERVCAEILKYLFPNDLHGWHSQKRTDDGLNRFDFVCRVRPTTEFWRFLIDHLNSRYVMFEFKNYSGKIKQGQILTTEKYLLERGLRRVAIILTRAGAEPHAIAMTQGAMREHGKLMLIINDETLCEMLHMKQRGEDPTDCLFELADNFLLSLPR